MRRRRPRVIRAFDSREYYDAPHTISYGAHLTMVVTMRSRGKTYGFIKAAVKDWLRDGSQFVLVRRYVTELEEQFPRMFQALERNDEFPGYAFKCTGMRAYIARATPEQLADGKFKPDWQLIAYGIPLSKQANFKGSEFAYVKKIIFDEFIRTSKTPPGYLRDDVGAFLDLFKTISRDRENVYAYLLGNACDLTNPYFRFIGQGTEPREGYTWHNNHQILLHYEKDSTFRAQELQTVVGKLVQGTAYQGVMIDNEFANGGLEFIETKTKNAKYSYGIRFQGTTFGVWVDYISLTYYICGKVPSDGIVYALTAEDMTLNATMLGLASPFIKSLMQLFRMGSVRFDTAARRESFLDMLRLCGLR